MKTFVSCVPPLFRLLEKTIFFLSTIVLPNPSEIKKTKSPHSGTRTTGKAYVVGLPSDYASFAPDEIRPLLGDPHAVALQQQH